MDHTLPASRPILIAIPDDWQTYVVQFVTQCGYPILTALSYQEALDHVTTYALRGLITTEAWALRQDNDNYTLFERIRGQIPTLTLIKQGGNPVIIQVFDPPQHQYLTVPFAEDELLGLMRRAPTIEESSS